MEYINDAGTLILDATINISRYAFEIYKQLNPKIFPQKIMVPKIFEACLQQIFEAHQQFVQMNTFELVPIKHMEPNNKVLLACSGGLDSIYQAFILREQGYDVTLFHVKNMNYYSNGKEFEVVKDFSNTFKFPLRFGQIKQNTKTTNVFKKYWKENSFKNILLYCMMIDYCVEHNIYNISCGDDLSLDIKDAVVGTNVADAKQVTMSFINTLNILSNINFLFVDVTQHKGIRLKKIFDNNAQDLFYSCVNSGRFNQSNHKRVSQKFNVDLEKYNCGMCRKCAFHSLLRHYFLNESFPQQFINYCWEKIQIGADYEFFKPTLSLEQRIHNLYNY